MVEGKMMLDIVTPERKLVSAEVDEVTAPGFYGEFGVLPQHTPYLCQLGVGVLSYRTGSARYFISIIDGYAEVGPDKITILAESAERAEDIDAARAQESRQRAQERMGGQKSEEELDFDRAELSLKRAITRISVANQSGLNN
ncbi:MAG: F0F1 ATP synthase subunit epsilon [Nitrospinae bacterium]|nr:F0F1 ATP synthase subunit epsilon [Nitrospinota bacterium]MCY4384247.1 F0F1 ATP synthase subunit epsilon [Nitrospinota bacterium]